MEPPSTKKELIFDSDDTEASDLSYESSFELDNEEEVPANKKARHFKEEMTRFFLNHPELKNDELINNTTHQNKSKFNRGEPWACIAEDILQDAKNTSQVPALKAFSKRLDLYRKKVEKAEVVDLILQEHVRLLKQIDMEIQKKESSENTIDNNIQAKFKKETGDVTYYSWRKNKQLEFRIDKAKEQARQKQKDESFSQKPSENKNEILSKINPKTEPVKMLVEELKRCPDVLSMKKVLINFLIKYREQIDREFKNRPSLLQQSQKYYTEETKEFVILYPNYQLKKRLEAEGITKEKLQKGPAHLPQDASNAARNNFEVMKGLNKIVNGSLMTYWKAAQDKKL